MDRRKRGSGYRVKETHYTSASIADAYRNPTSIYKIRTRPTEQSGKRSGTSNITMNIMRSPTKGASAGPSISNPQSDLSKLSASDTDLRNVAMRKRKTQENNYAYEFGEFKKQILEIIKETNIQQIESMNNIGQNIQSINEQLKDMKNTTEHLIIENGLLKTQITNLNTTVKINEERIISLQNEIKELKSHPKTFQPSSSELTPTIITSCDDAIMELQERAERSKNIIITGISEQICSNAIDRRELDAHKAFQIMQIIHPGCPEIKKVFRLGKYEDKKTRPLKICFDSQDTVKTILRNKLNVKLDGVRVFSDQTPYQQKYMANLKKELHQRQENGETNLTIKYIKGTPKIVKMQPKN